MAKRRLDLLLTERGLVPSRERAKSLIMAGVVYVNGQKEDKAGTGFDPDPDKTRIEVRGQVLPYVSRGGLKLEKALRVFPIRLAGKTCMDIGASTGGFTDCMLQNGAARVFSIDVGYGQLDWKLRNDPRVICMEKTNFRYVTEETLFSAVESGRGAAEPVLEDRRGRTGLASMQAAEETAPASEESSGESSEKSRSGIRVDFASCDVSFISLRIILPPAYAILSPGAQMVCLIKPQFEAGRENVGKKGVVRDRGVHRDVIRACTDYAREAGFRILGLDYSPIRGPEGNIEYLMWLDKPAEVTTAQQPEASGLRESSGLQGASEELQGAAELQETSELQGAAELQETSELQGSAELQETSELQGAAGLQKTSGLQEVSVTEDQIRELVDAAHAELDR